MNIKLYQILKELTIRYGDRITLGELIQEIETDGKSKVCSFCGGNGEFLSKEFHNNKKDIKRSGSKNRILCQFCKGDGYVPNMNHDQHDSIS